MAGLIGRRDWWHGSGGRDRDLSMMTSSDSFELFCQRPLPSSPVSKKYLDLAHVIFFVPRTLMRKFICIITIIFQPTCLLDGDKPQRPDLMLGLRFLTPCWTLSRWWRMFGRNFWTRSLFGARSRPRFLLMLRPSNMVSGRQLT